MRLFHLPRPVNLVSFECATNLMRRYSDREVTHWGTLSTEDFVAQKNMLDAIEAFRTRPTNEYRYVNEQRGPEPRAA